ncbi:LOW QUALITY PROTEIN: uncharacterized protein T551_00660 [Pneumocystis jirovecii RU7]|uniref:Uncharacterized protein n=1 Tax=Pneumocystis jirovecii (strain RU7) TaxID=1408657 RepID=A0A0W4ZUC3_PNEJ7|nr:LOW QUALITY PROTEIN: uncharacterized protein T551_00660 [Pneumocystis jirovecii RU7]KTW31978.1 LOW QUALITY PROTEIN: hypothetical protein T551_00660 [Pneumocystis jirovecii RU7]
MILRRWFDRRGRRFVERDRTLILRKEVKKRELKRKKTESVFEGKKTDENRRNFKEIGCLEEVWKNELLRHFGTVRFLILVKRFELCGILKEIVGNVFVQRSIKGNRKIAMMIVGKRSDLLNF